MYIAPTIVYIMWSCARTSVHAAGLCMRRCAGVHRHAGGVRGRMRADAGGCGRTRAYAYKGRILVKKGRKKAYDLYTVLSVRGAYAGRTRVCTEACAECTQGAGVCTQNGVACAQRRWHICGVCGHACARVCEHTWYKHSAHLVILASWFPNQSNRLISRNPRKLFIRLMNKSPVDLIP